MRSEDQLLANKSTRRSRGLLFDNNWSSDRIIYGCLSSLAKKLPILKFCTRGIRADYFLNRTKPNALFPILFIENNLKKNQVPTFREIFSGYFFVFSSIFVTQLVAKHMKSIIRIKMIIREHLKLVSFFI
jgi:hypothetical protein